MDLNSNSGTKYERWIWIELIGFDNTQPDCGVAEYLDRIGFIPDEVSYLITAPDIIHHHEGIETEIEFPPDYCSYCGHPRNSERERQVWTNHQLKKLTSALQARGIKVFLATFTFFLNNTFHHEWVNDHQELLEVRRNGEAITALQPLKRFANGTFYEDFFIERLTRVLDDYGFDGWHAADGWGPARLPLNETDYSNDMFEQFVGASGVEVPEAIAMQCAEPSQYEARADWIWGEQRRAWIDFYTDRWASFYRKKVAAIKKLGKAIVINSAWTRDPFEAIYRYGIDYRKIIAAGVDGIVTESAAGASDMEAESGRRLDNYVAALLLIRAAVPRTHLVFLHGVNDTMEQWDLIHHAPTVLETEIFSLSGIYLCNGESHMKRCADGFVVCLGDGISEEEWRWLKKRWEPAFSELPVSMIGATLVWSDRALDNELNDFIEYRGWTTHRLLHKLMEHGAPVHSAVRMEDLESAHGPILVLNGHLLPDEELKRVQEYRNGPVLIVSRNEVEGQKPDVKVMEENSLQNLRCRVYGWSERPDSVVTPREIGPAILGRKKNIEPITFLEDMPVQPLSDEFIACCAELIGEVSATPRVVNDVASAQVKAMQFADGTRRLLVRNSNLSYASPVIDVGEAIESVKVVTEFPCTPIEPDGSRFRIKVPGRGSVVVDVRLAGREAVYDIT